jgi:fatty-acyl-CoA synthase
MSNDLFDRLVNAGGSALHCWTGTGFDRTPWPDVVREAEAMTAGLRRRGVRPGTRVATVLTNTPTAVRGLLAVWLAGGAVASLPAPARGMRPEEYVRALGTICAQLGPELFVVDEAMLGVVPAEWPARPWQSFVDSGRVAPEPPEEDELAFVQYSSGSTSAPKGCMLTPRAIAAQLDLVMEMLDARPGREIAVSWLPLSHDMGVFGCLLTPWANDFELYLSTPERFAFTPRTWFGDLAEFGGTMTAGTNTALYLATRAYAGRSRLTRELNVRSCIVGAERVEWETLRFATETFAPYGFTPRSLMPAYGLAEATLAVTATPAGAEPRHVTVDVIALADGELREVDAADETATRLVAAGTPCRGVELTAGDELGEITVRSPCLATGYLGDPARTAEKFAGGTLRTGDLGFVRDGWLYPVGRTDDMISVAGRKVYAREIETAVDTLDGVRRGCSTLVAAGRTLTLFVELRRGLADYRPLAEEAASLAMAKAAVALDECVFLRHNSLPKTPSGKIQRHRCRQLLDAGRFEPLATVNLAGGGVR